MIPRVVVALACLLTIGILGCGGGDAEADAKAQALSTARTWTETEPEKLITPIVGIVTSGIPGSSLFSGLIAEQVADTLTWTLSEPVIVTGDIYKVIATASVETTLDIPLVGEKTYGVRLPFNLQVNSSTSTVTEWSPDLDSASLGELESAQ